MFKSINGGQLPQRATKYSAGFDVYSNEDVVIGAGETKLIGLGIALDIKFNLYREPYTCNNPEFDPIEMLTDHYFALHIRSSLRAKGLTSLGTGIIDMDYRDEIKMVIHNPISKPMIKKHKGSNDFGHYIMNGSGYEIKRGDKIGQLILCRHEGWLLPSEYTKDEERTGGFGSSGER